MTRIDVLTAFDPVLQPIGHALAAEFRCADNPAEPSVDWFAPSEPEEPDLLTRKAS